MSAPARSGRPALLAGGAVLGLALVWALSSWTADRRLDRSAAGFEGLALWLTARDVEARLFRGGDALTADRVGLRVLPLYDVDLDLYADELVGDRERLLAETERDIADFVVARKIAALPTLVALPKWRAGLRSLGLAHPELLVAPSGAGQAARQIRPELRAARLEIVRLEGWIETGWRASGEAPLEAAPGIRLYHPQLIRGAPCEPLIGRAEGMLLGRCALEDRHRRDGDETAFYLLSDPDLLNNHGLSWGRNAEVALALAEHFAGDKPVIVDASTQVWASSAPTAPPRARSWSDLARFVEGPFAVLWAAFGLLAALTLWRAWVRDRAALPPAPEGVEATREAAIEAKARLLRLSGHDVALTRAHLADRLQALAAELLGPRRAAGAAGLAQLRRALARRAGPLALELDGFAAGETPPLDASSAELFAHLDRFDRFADAARRALGADRPPDRSAGSARAPRPKGSP